MILSPLGANVMLFENFLIIYFMQGGVEEKHGDGI